MTIEHVTRSTLSEILPLIRQYQQFYQVKDISDARNEAFFAQFTSDANENAQFLYRGDNQQVIGFATVYFSYASTVTSKVAIMNDLFTTPEARGQGVGRQLIEHCRQYAQSCGAARLQWSTALDNEAAQKLYNTLEAKKSNWLVYAYPCEDPSS